MPVASATSPSLCVVEPRLLVWLPVGCVVPTCQVPTLLAQAEGSVPVVVASKPSVGSLLV